MMGKTHHKMIVACMNSAGAPEFHTCAPLVTEEEIQAGEHYEAAKENARFNGYDEPMIAFDASDPAWKQMADLVAWQ